MSTDDALDRLAKLSPGWDDGNAPRIDRRAIEAVSEFLAGAQVVPLNDGGIQVEWHGDSWDVELEFCPDGTVDTLGGHHRGYSWWSDEPDRVNRDQA